jgi:serine/threonine-protein kinase
LTLHNANDQITDRYQIVTFIDEGGMQEVYRANDLVLQKQVALKVPKTQSAQRRFGTSAVLSAKVNHPNAAKTLDYFDFNGRPYLIEELIEGENLARVRQRLPVMDPYAVAHVLHHMARGIAASHHVDVVHRDLKPSNIMVAPQLTFQYVKITDFGIAKMAEDEIITAVEGGAESITGSQTMVGALPYMSPEMVSKPRTASFAADVWAIGSIAFELLTGTAPFGRGLAAVPRIQAGTPPPLPGFITGNTQFKGLAEELFKIITACWTKDPAHRPTADQIVAACGTLCYPMTSYRVQGRVDEIRYGRWGFLMADNRVRVFFHLDSVFGPVPAANDAVYFAYYAGLPKPRAHPVVKLLPPPPPPLPF